MSSDSPASPVAPGETLAGKYRIERVLGAGGMGVVVAARHLQLDQMVAVKFVLPSAAKDAVATERFLRESRLAVKLRSEHVAKVLDVGTLDSGAPYMVMEYLEGTNLTELPARKQTLSVETAVGFVLQACEALGEAHALGIVHRDLKPHNLFVTTGVSGNPLVKVLDFGISKILDSSNAPHLTQTTTVMGSPTYMAPEQMRSSRDVDARADVWAIGVVLYELLTGRPPFEADTVAGLALKIAQDPPVPVHDVRADVPPELAAIVARCLEKAPEKRFSDAGALGLALEPFAARPSRSSIRRTGMISVSSPPSTVGPRGSGSSDPALPRAGSPGRSEPSVQPAPGSRVSLTARSATPPSSLGQPEHSVAKPETGAPWSESRPSTHVSGSAPGKGVWIPTLVTVSALIGVVVFRFVAHSGSSEPAPSTASEPAKATSGPPAPAESAAAPPASTTTAGSAANDETPPSAAPAEPSANPMVVPAAMTGPEKGEPRTVVETPTEAAKKHPKAHAGAHATPSAHRGDDDIPSFR